LSILNCCVGLFLQKNEQATSVGQPPIRFWIEWATNESDSLVIPNGFGSEESVCPPCG
jgi:hypothetical protein